MIRPTKNYEIGIYKRRGNEYTATMRLWYSGITCVINASVSAVDEIVNKQSYRLMESENFWQHIGAIRALSLLNILKFYMSYTGQCIRAAVYIRMRKCARE
jgi:hypothetical protein